MKCEQNNLGLFFSLTVVSKSFSWIIVTQRTSNQVHTTCRKNGAAKTSLVWILVKSSPNQAPRAIEYSELVANFKRSTDFRSPQNFSTALTITFLVSKSFSWIRGTQRTLNRVYTKHRKNSTAKTSPV